MHDSVLITPAHAHAALVDLEREVNRIQRSIRLAIQLQLGKLAGQSLRTLGENQDLVKRVHDLLDSHGLRVKCPECGHPAILRVSARPGANAGVFVLDHTIDGKRTFHGGRQVIPEILITAKPARRKIIHAPKPRTGNPADLS